MAIENGLVIGELPAASGLTSATKIEIETDTGLSLRTTLGALATWLLSQTSIVPANLPWRGVTCSRTADDTTARTLPSSIDWASAAGNSEGMWNSMQPSRITVPTGVSRVRINMLLKWLNANAARAVNMILYKNGEATPVALHTVTTNTSYATFSLSMASPVLNVVPGDYFELRINATTTLTVAADTSMQLEIVEYTA